MHEAQAITWCVICVQRIARDLESLKDPSISEGRREWLERKVKSMKDAIQVHQAYIESCDSQLQGESCPKGNRS